MNISPAAAFVSSPAARPEPGLPNATGTKEGQRQESLTRPNQPRDGRTGARAATSAAGEELPQDHKKEGRGQNFSQQRRYKLVFFSRLSEIWS